MAHNPPSNLNLPASDIDGRTDAALKIFSQSFSRRLCFCQCLHGWGGQNREIYSRDLDGLTKVHNNISTVLVLPVQNHVQPHKQTYLQLEKNSIIAAWATLVRIPSLVLARSILLFVLLSFQILRAMVVEANESRQGDQDALILNLTASLGLICAMLCAFSAHGVGAHRVGVMTQVSVRCWYLTERERFTHTYRQQPSFLFSSRVHFTDKRQQVSCHKPSPSRTMPCQRKV